MTDRNDREKEPRTGGLIPFAGPAAALAPMLVAGLL